MENILEIKDLHTYFYTREGTVKAVEGVSFSVQKGEILGLVGESACGKTVTAYSVLDLIQPPGRIVNGEIIFKGRDIRRLSRDELRALRGKEIAMVFQEPSMSLNPLYTLGFQIGEAIAFHERSVSKSERSERIVTLLERVGIARGRLRMNDYPHQVSGGQAQRAMIAMGLACNPELLIADEPTTSLDVTIQAQIMDLFLELQEQSRFSLVLITHNLALCSQVADRVAIMYAGKIVELAGVDEIFRQPLHPYTKALFSSIPHSNDPKKKLAVIAGVVPRPEDKPAGCYFHPRCPFKKEVCTVTYPDYTEVAPGHWVGCHFWKELYGRA